MNNKKSAFDRTIHFSKYSILGLALVSAISAQAKVYLCQDIFLNLPEVAYLDGAPQISALDKIKFNLIERAKLTTRRLEQSYYVAYYDVVIVGAGPHGASAAALLSSLAPQLRVLTISKEAPGHVFNSVGDAMWINSPELAGGISSNILPGTNLGLRHIGEITDFKMASDLGNYVAATLEGSKSDFLITKVDQIRTKKHGLFTRRAQKNYKEELLLSNGITVNARQVIIASGLGEPRLPIKNPNELEALKNLMAKESTMDKSAARSVEVFDNAIVRWAEVIRQTPEIRLTENYKNSDVLIIGAGDSANVLAEGLTGRGPGKLYALKENGVVGQVQEAFKVGGELGVKSLTIAGMKATDPESFKKDNKRRYDSTMAVQIGTDILGAPKVTNIEPILNGANGIKVSVKFDNDEVRVFDHVLIATGYENKVFDFLGEPETSSTSIYGIVNGQQTIVATGLAERESIAIAGPAAGAISNETDLANSITKNAASINVLGLKTKAMVEKIIQKLTN